MSLFSRIQPDKTFQINTKDIAELLGIHPNMILRIERWKYVLFVHRRDIGGQFISYRRLRNWQHAVALRIQICNTKQKLETLWLTIKQDSKKYAKQYQAAYHVFIKRVWTQQWDKLAEKYSPPLVAIG